MLENELIHLFGNQIVKDSDLLPIEMIDPEAVAIVAKALLALRDSPTAQKQLVGSLDRQTAVSLCKWLNNNQTNRQLIGTNTH
jgi:hypothetical protein